MGEALIPAPRMHLSRDDLPRVTHTLVYALLLLLLNTTDSCLCVDADLFGLPNCPDSCATKSTNHVKHLHVTLCALCLLANIFYILSLFDLSISCFPSLRINILLLCCNFHHMIWLFE